MKSFLHTVNLATKQTALYRSAFIPEISVSRVENEAEIADNKASSTSTVTDCAKAA